MQHLCIQSDHFMKISVFGNTFPEMSTLNFQSYLMILIYIIHKCLINDEIVNDHNCFC